MKAPLVTLSFLVALVVIFGTFPLSRAVAASPSESRRGDERAAAVTVVVTGAEGARVTIDGRDVGFAPLTVQLGPGIHAVQAELKGYFPTQTSVSIDGTDPKTVTLTLQRVLVTSLDEASRASEPREAGRAQVEAGGSAGNDALAWTMLGTGVAAFVAGGALLGHVAWLETRELRPGQRVQGASAELGAGAALAALGIGLGVGSIWVFEPDAPVALRLAPGGVIVSGAF